MNTCKYFTYRKYVSYDNGNTWSPTDETHRGMLIERDSVSCGGGYEAIYKWVVVEGDYTCQGVDKYEKTEKYVSYNNGETWEKVIPAEYGVGDLIEAQSEDCGYIEPQYRTISGDPYCVVYDKYIDVYSQVSYDEGVTWETTATTPTLVEAQSEDCGYVPPTPTNYKLQATYSDSSTYNLECDSSSAITSGEVRAHSTSYSAMTSAVIGDCVNKIGNSSFNSCSGLTSVTIGSNVTMIGNSAFYRCQSLSSITIPSGVTSIGYAAFNACSGLTSINIPSGVTSISRLTFALCYSLSSITIPNTVTSIGELAFQDCTSLASVEIPSGVTSIGRYAFQHCISLTNINIPSGVTSIEGNTFQNCSSLTHIDIPSGVTLIGTSAFNGCTSLSSITINATTPPVLVSSAFTNTNDCPIYVPCASVDTYKSASDWSEYVSRIQGIPPCEEPEPQYRTTSGTPYCSGASGYDKYVDVYSQVSYDGGTTWETTATTPTLVEAQSEDCGYVPPTPTSYKLKTYSDYFGSKIPCDSTSAITSGDVFSRGINSATIGDCVISIEDNTFSGCTRLPIITIPNSVTNIGDRAFYNCSGLTSVTFGNNVESIGDYAFNKCKSLSSVIIPDSVTSIGDYAFEICSGLTSITIGSGVTKIGANAFASNVSLQSITITAPTPPSIFQGDEIYYPFYRTNDCPIYVPCQSLDAYRYANDWYVYASRIQGIPPCEEPTPIGPKLLATYSDSSTYELPCDSTSAITSGEIDSHTTVRSEMTNAIIGDCVTSIKGGSFSGCTSLTSCTIGSGVRTINSSAFRACSGLTSVVFNNRVKYIGSNAFYVCKGLTSISIPNSVQYIGQNAFQSCTSLTSVTIGSGVTKIYGGTFKYCSSLTSITINAKRPPTIVVYDVFDDTNNCPIYVPSTSVNAYKTASGWSNYASRIQAIPT